MDRGYAVAAQYYDAMAAEAQAEVTARIAAALAGLPTDGGPVLDVGAGTGLTTQAIAEAAPEVEIWAVEPDPVMRPALLTRVWANPDLRRRVTILPTGLLEAPLPERIAGAVLSASLVHFSPADRARLWERLAARLSPGGRIIAQIQCPEAVDLPETLMASERVGRVLYEGWAAAERIDADRQRWRMVYRAGLGDQVLAADSCEYVCWAVSADQVVGELGRVALQARIEGSLVIATLS